MCVPVLLEHGTDDQRRRHIPDMLAGRGWMTAAHDPASLRQGIRFVLEHPEQIDSFAAPCREYVRAHFESQRIAGRYRELLIGGLP